MITIFKKDYDGESLYDLGRDVQEAMDARFNPRSAEVPQDDNGIQKGTFTVLIEWKPE